MGNVRVRLHVNKRTGEVIELSVHDDTAPEHMHVALAEMIANELVPGSEITEARRLATDDLAGATRESDPRGRQREGGGRGRERP